MYGNKGNNLGEWTLRRMPFTEITTPSVPPSVLLNDSPDAGARAAEIVTAPSGATFFEFEWDACLEMKGRYRLRSTYVVREYEALYIVRLKLPDS